MNSYEEIQTKLLDRIDLTGDEPVVTTETIHEKIATVDLVNLNETQVNSNGTDQKKMKRAKCEVCSEEQSKYTCPACHVKTCCLACVTKHKALTSCTGERDKTKFVGKTEFDNIHLLNDYRFLEDVHRIADNAKRDYKTRQNTKPQMRDVILQKAALRSGVKLIRMAKGMQRWRQNKSYYIVKEQVILWTVKFLFDDMNAEEVIGKYPETYRLQDILNTYIDINTAKPENKIRFSSYINRGKDDHVHVYLSQDIEPGKENLKYFKCDIADTIKTSLNNKTILEYPTYHVVLSATSNSLSQQQFKKGMKSSNFDITGEPEKKIMKL